MARLHVRLQCPRPARNALCNLRPDPCEYMNVFGPPRALVARVGRCQCWSGKSLTMKVCEGIVGRASGKISRLAALQQYSVALRHVLWRSGWRGTTVAELTAAPNTGPAGMRGWPPILAAQKATTLDRPAQILSFIRSATWLLVAALLCIAIDILFVGHPGSL